MRRETADLIGSGLLFAALITATFAVLAPTIGASTAAPQERPSRSTLVERGQMLFYAKGCVACHQIAGIDAGTDVGPPLSDLAESAGTRRPGLSAEAYVIESLRSPNAFTVPGYREGAMPELALKDDEVDALLAFLFAPR